MDFLDGTLNVDMSNVRQNIVNAGKCSERIYSPQNVNKLSLELTTVCPLSNIIVIVINMIFAVDGGNEL